MPTLAARLLAPATMPLALGLNGCASLIGLEDYEATCRPGVTRCENDALQQCNADGQWETSAMCPNICVELNNRPQCVDCLPTKIACDGANNLQVCDSDGHWEFSQKCPEVCATIGGQDQCVACEPGHNRCSGSELQSCSDNGTWGPGQKCLEVCTTVGGQDQCTDCLPGSLRCLGSDLQFCNGNGTWELSQKCLDICTTIGGQDQCADCLPGDLRCAGSDLQFCNNGAWALSQMCSEVCTEIVGQKQCANCVPGDQKCIGNDLQTCNDGGNWELGQCPQLCTVVGGKEQCADCVPNDKECWGSELQLCNSNGNWELAQQCPEVCLKINGQAQCVSCVPGDKRCSANNAVEVCDDTGQWSPSPCPSGQTCCGGECRDLESDSENCGQCSYSCQGGNCVASICQPLVLWGKVFGGTSMDSIRGAAVDSLGNLIIAGDFSNSINIDGVILNSFDDNEDAFIAKFDPNGTVLWARRFGGPSHDHAGGVAVDDQDNVILTGGYSNSIDFAPAPGVVIPNPSQTEVFLVKIDPTGNILWGIGFGGAVKFQISEAWGYPNNEFSHTWSTGVSTDPWGNIFVGGSFIFQTRICGSEIIVSGGSSDEDSFVAKFDNNGNCSWVKRLSGSADSHDWINTVASDSLGNVIVGGDIEGLPIAALSVNYNVGFVWDHCYNGYPYCGGFPSFLGGFSAQGNKVWGSLFGSPFGAVRVDSVAAATQVVALGTMGDTISFGQLQPLFSGDGFKFLVSFDLSGVPVWSRNLPAGQRVALDNVGNILLGGSFFGTIDFGGTSFAMTNQGTRDGFVTKLDSGGNSLWAKQFSGSTGKVEASPIASGFGGSFVYGSFDTNININGAIFSTVGSNDIFVLKLSPP